MPPASCSAVTEFAFSSAIKASCDPGKKLRFDAGLRASSRGPVSPPKANTPPAVEVCALSGTDTSKIAPSSLMASVAGAPDRADVSISWSRSREPGKPVKTFTVVP